MVILVDGSVEEHLARGLEFVLTPQTVEEAMRGAKVWDSGRDRDTSTSNDNNLPPVSDSFQQGVEGFAMVILGLGSIRGEI